MPLRVEKRQYTSQSINQVEGSSVYIRNLSAFIGGKDSYSVKFITSHDISVALTKSRNPLTSSVTGFTLPVFEQVSGALTVTWRCQFVLYKVPSYMRVTAATLSGKNFLVDVVFVPRPVRGCG